MFLRRTVAVSKETEIHKLADSVTEQLYVADHTQGALEIIETAQPELVVLDANISKSSRNTFLTDIKENHGVPVVIANPGADDYAEANVYDALQKDNELEHLKKIAIKINSEKQAKNKKSNNDFYLDE